MSNKMIACTQSRPVDVRLRKEVGYSIQFEDMKEPGTTFLKWMTDGILVAGLVDAWRPFI